MEMFMSFNALKLIYKENCNPLHERNETVQRPTTLNATTTTKKNVITCNEYNKVGHVCGLSMNDAGLCNGKLFQLRLRFIKLEYAHFALQAYQTIHNLHQPTSTMSQKLFKYLLLFEIYFSA